jgi:actin-related protein 2
VKVGLAGQNFPAHIFPSMIGRPILRAEEGGLENVVLKDIMIGDEANNVRSALQISYPVENGIVNNWADMEHLWNYTFCDKLGYKLGVRYHPPFLFFVLLFLFISSS